MSVVQYSYVGFTNPNKLVFEFIPIRLLKDVTIFKILNKRKIMKIFFILIL